MMSMAAVSMVGAANVCTSGNGKCLHERQLGCLFERQSSGRGSGSGSGRFASWVLLNATVFLRFGDGGSSARRGGGNGRRVACNGGAVTTVMLCTTTATTAAPISVLSAVGAGGIAGSFLAELEFLQMDETMSSVVSF